MFKMKINKSSSCLITLKVYYSVVLLMFNNFIQQLLLAYLKVFSRHHFRHSPTNSLSRSSVGPKAEVLRPQPKIQDLRLRLRWPKFKAIPTAEGFYWQFSQVLPKWRLKCVFHYTGATLDQCGLSLKIRQAPF